MSCVMVNVIDVPKANFTATNYLFGFDLGVSVVVSIVI